MTALQVLVVLAYASLVFECFVWRVPSVASTYELVQKGEVGLAAKALRYILPVVLVVALYLTPFALAFAPSLRDALVPFELPAGFAVAAGALIVAGRALTLSAVGALRAALRDPQLLRHGAFRRSRNPALLGLHLFFFLGNCFAFPCAVLFGGFALWCWHMDLRVRIEEAHLSARYGEDYAAYRRAVRRYF